MHLHENGTDNCGQGPVADYCEHGNKSSKSFIYQQIQFISVLENIKIYVETAPTCFGLRPSSGSLHMSLAKVIDDGSRPKHVGAVLI